MDQQPQFSAPVIPPGQFQPTKSGGRHKVRWILICILGVVVLGVGGVMWYYYSNKLESDVPLLDCSEQKVEVGTSVSAQVDPSIKTTEPSAFVYQSKRNKEDEKIYTNASKLQYSVSVVASGGLEIGPATVSPLTPELGKISTRNVSDLYSIMGLCVDNGATLNLTYELSSKMLQENATDSVIIRGHSNGQEVSRTFLVVPAVWSRGTFSSQATLVSKKTNIYQARVNSEVVFTMELKKADGSPLSGLSLTLAASPDQYLDASVIKPFAETSPGIYEITVTSPVAGSVGMTVKAAGGYTLNPQYNQAVLEFVDA